MNKERTRMAMSEESRQKLREQIQITKPWLKSTGAKTPEGKMRSSQNGLKHGRYSALEVFRTLARWEREEQEMKKFRARAIEMRDAYAKSNTPPPQLWDEVFDHMTREDFIELWNKLE